MVAWRHGNSAGSHYFWLAKIALCAWADGKTTDNENGVMLLSIHLFYCIFLNFFLLFSMVDRLLLLQRCDALGIWHAWLQPSSPLTEELKQRSSSLHCQGMCKAYFRSPDIFSCKYGCSRWCQDVKYYVECKQRTFSACRLCAEFCKGKSSMIDIYLIYIFLNLGVCTIYQ